MIKYDYKTIQSLRYVKYRNIYNKFIIEGKKIIESALNQNIKIGPVFCTDNFFGENKIWFKKTLNRETLVKVIDIKAFLKMSGTKSPQGILTICDIPKNNHPNLTLNKWIYLDKISDPGNMGTLIRSCAWFGIKNIALSPQCVDPYNPKTVRAAMGAHFLVTIQKKIELSIFKNTHKIIGANLKGLGANTYVFSDKCVLVLGNEAHGISNQNQNWIEDYIFIDKIGLGNSLNVSVAGSILMYLMMKR
tara:strand:+ start:4826 stop:5566 length:741 start_codon:yes stop_codon:yes gene_type:complete